MKYHSTPMTILISLFVVLLFVGVSLFILSQLNLTSPTLIVTNRFFDEIEALDSDIGVSFSSIERNLRDGITIHDIQISYKDETMLSLEKVSLNRGLFSFISYVITGQDKLGVTASGGYLRLPEGDNQSKSSKSLDDILNTQINITVPDILKRYGLDLNVSDFDVILSENMRIEDSNIALEWNNGIKGSSAEVEIPRFIYNDEIHLTTKGIKASLKEDSGLFASLSLESLSSSYNNVKFVISGISTSASSSTIDVINLRSMPLDIAFAKADLRLDDLSLSLGDAGGTVDTESASLLLNTIKFAYKDYKANISKAQVSTEGFEKLVLSINSSDVFENQNVLMRMPVLKAEYDLKDSNASLSIPLLTTGNLDGYTKGYIGGVSATSVEVNASFASSIAADISLSTSIKSANELIDGSSMIISASGEMKDEALTGFDIKVSDLIVPKLIDPIQIHLNGEGETISLSASFDDSVFADGVYDGNLKAGISFEHFRLNTLGFLVDEFAPALREYITADTSLYGKINVDFASDKESPIGFSGPVDYELGLDSIRFNDSSFDLETSFDALFKSEGVTVDKMDVSTHLVDLLYVGSFSYDKLLPEGHFVLFSPERDTSYLSADLTVSDYKEYTFFGTTPKLRDTSILGVVNFAEEKKISSEFQLKVLGSSYPLDLDLDLNEKHLALLNDRLDLSVRWKDLLEISLDLQQFQLSEETPEFVPSSFTGHIALSFDFAEQKFSLDIPSLYFADIFRLPGNPDFYFSASGNNNEIHITDVGLVTEGLPSLTGNGLLDFRKASFALAMNDDKNEKVLVSVIKHEGEFVGSIKIDNLKMDRLGLNDMLGAFNLTGRALKLEDFAFSGYFDAFAEDKINDLRTINADIYIDDGIFRLSNIVYSNDIIASSIDMFSFDSSTGKLTIDNLAGGISLKHADGLFNINGAVSLSADLPQSDTIISSITELISRKGKGLTFEGSLLRAGLDDQLFADHKSFTGNYDGSRINLNGDFLSGFYSLQDGDIDIRLNIDPLLDVRLLGDTKVDGKYDLKVEANKLDLSFINYVFSQPVVQFTPGYFAYGDIYISPDEGSFNLRGSFSSDYAEMDIFWLPDQKVILHDINFLVWDNDFENVMCNATVLNLNTYEKTPVDVRFGITFNEAFAYEGWDLDVYIDEGDLIDFRMPLPSSNIDLWGKVNGHLGIIGVGTDVDIFGEVSAESATGAFGMNPIPAWFNPTSKTTLSLDITMKNNIQFIFPLAANPILKMNLADDSFIHFEMGPSGIKADGDLPLRSGEIFYFQKYFYITEGDIKLREGVTGLDPIINLRARLRDFDENGEKVDIYLVLRDATLNNISPSLESSPNKDINEIMSILGNSILPTSAVQSASNAEAVASIAAASVDILQKFGILGNNDGGLDNSIRQALSLDTFSLHSNILANFLTDTVSLTGFATSSPYSPMARYLDGTTLYLGKYLSRDFYLQALVHLSADRGTDNGGFAFIADDLILDTEVSLEWTNPLATVTFFTKPSNFTIYELIDKFGFSINKRILF